MGTATVTGRSGDGLGERTGKDETTVAPMRSVLDAVEAKFVQFVNACKINLYHYRTLTSNIEEASTTIEHEERRLLSNNNILVPKQDLSNKHQHFGAETRERIIRNID